MSIISKKIIQITSYFKPILLKIFPNELLRKYKRKMIDNSLKKMEKIQLMPYKIDDFKKGINLIGDMRAETGLGQSCRLVAGLLQKAGIPFSIYQYNRHEEATNEDNLWKDRISNELPYGINLIHINPHELGIAYIELDAKIWKGRYNIAYWLWELEEFPDEWTPCFNCFHEIWTPSEFISRTIRKKTSLPVKTIPYYMELTCEEIQKREYFDLPSDKFLYLMMYDPNSITERKNPVGVLEAFKKAFDIENKEVGLVIKINNCEDQDLKDIKAVLGGYQNIYFIKQTLSRDEVNSLIQCTDVFVSLHRAEGFGLVLAEAMYLGTPTIATNWSSNTEFMNRDVACMVDYELVTLERDLLPFKAGNHWADPDINQAAEYMKKLYEDKDFYTKLSVNARKHIREVLGLEKIKKVVEGRMEDIYCKVI